MARKQKPKSGALAVPESYANSMPANVPLNGMEYLVAYKVSGVARRAGPYETYDEAYYHARDIEGYEGVSDVTVIFDDT